MRKVFPFILNAIAYGSPLLFAPSAALSCAVTQSARGSRTDQYGLSAPPDPSAVWWDSAQELDPFTERQAVTL